MYDTTRLIVLVCLARSRSAYMPSEPNPHYYTSWPDMYAKHFPNSCSNV